MPSQLLTRIQKLPRWTIVWIAVGGIALAGIPFLILTSLQRSDNALQAIIPIPQDSTTDFIIDLIAFCSGLWLEFIS
jgi:hypothetical protein